MVPSLFNMSNPLVSMTIPLGNGTNIVSNKKLLPEVVLPTTVAKALSLQNAAKFSDENWAVLSTNKYIFPLNPIGSTGLLFYFLNDNNQNLFCIICKFYLEYD